MKIKNKLYLLFEILFFNLFSTFQMKLANLQGDAEKSLKVIRSQFSKYFDYGGNIRCIQSDK